MVKLIQIIKKSVVRHRIDQVTHDVYQRIIVGSGIKGIAYLGYNNAGGVNGFRNRAAVGILYISVSLVHGFAYAVKLR